MTDQDQAERCLRAYLAVDPRTARLDAMRLDALVDTFKLQGLRYDASAFGCVRTNGSLDASTELDAIQAKQPFLFQVDASKPEEKPQAPSVDSELVSSFNGGGRASVTAEVLKRNASNLRGAEVDTDGNPWLTGNRTAQLAIQARDPKRAERLQAEAREAAQARINEQAQASRERRAERPRNARQRAADRRARQAEIEAGQSAIIRYMGGHG